MNKSDISRNQFMLQGPLEKNGYDWWWHSFTGINETTGEEKSFFIEFFTCNPALHEDRPVLGQEENNKREGKRPSYIMVKVGCWGKDAVQLHRFFPWKDTKITNIPSFVVEAKDCYLSETHTKGCVTVSEEDSMHHPEYMSDAGSMSWELKINKKVAFHVGYGANKLFRKLNAFEMYWHAEGMKTEYEGTVNFNGEVYTINPKTSYGYADKNWGSNFTSPWVWLSSNHLYSLKSKKELKNSVFDIGGGCPKVFGIPLKRKLLSDFYYEGKSYEFNFSKFWTITRTKFDCIQTDQEIIWKVCQETTKTLIKVEVRCKKEDMLFIKYEAPDGQMRHKQLWNGGNGRGIIKLYTKEQGKLTLLDHIKAEHVGCEYGEYEK